LRANLAEVLDGNAVRIVGDAWRARAIIVPCQDLHPGALPMPRGAVEKIRARFEQAIKVLVGF
jgi:hypothetical protein